jgi:hypothetical protein
MIGRNPPNVAPELLRLDVLQSDPSALAQTATGALDPLEKARIMLEQVILQLKLV